MRNTLIIIALFIVHVTSAQVFGNKKMITTTISLEQIERVDIGLYAGVTIDASASSEYMTITIDENLLDLVGKKVSNGKLVLDQLEWIHPSERVIITIGAPNLNFISQHTHETTVVTGINSEQFNAVAHVGTIELHGQVEQLDADAEVGTVNAEGLEADKVQVNLWSWGAIQLGNPSTISGIAKNAGRVTYQSEPLVNTVKTKSDARVLSVNEFQNLDSRDTKWMDLKIKNNSTRRIQCYVRGPKPDGSYFSYGFPLNPNQVRDKRWTVGSKVFRGSGLGKRKLVEITAADEGKTVQLFN